MNILLAIDDSSYSKAVIDSVAQRPWPPESNFKVISVAEPFHPEYAGWQTNYVPLALEAQKVMTETTSRVVHEAVARLKGVFGHDWVAGEVIEGFIKDKILETAENWPADLIVVGSHGRKGFTKFLLGSVSEAIASHAHCSVEIIRSPQHMQERQNKQPDQAS